MATNLSIPPWEAVPTVPALFPGKLLLAVPPATYKLPFAGFIDST